MSLFTLIAFSLALSVLYYLCPGRFRWMLLLCSSLFFYVYSGIRALPFLLVTAGTTFYCALRIEAIGEAGKKERAALPREEKKAQKLRVRSRQRRWLLFCLLCNFGLLAVLKYTGDLSRMAASLLGREASPLGLLLPLGISFYTFQSTGYVLDVYNSKTKAQTHPGHYLLFVSFFPQLIQGPIARFEQLQGQLIEPHAFDIDRYERGLLLILWGFFKKKVLADRALPLVTEVFADPERYGGGVIVIAILMYSLQQYTDFSGGIDLVTGIAELFGIELAPNFRRPYFAVSLGDFWRRWHISLGAWMRDYVFYPFALSAPVSRMSRALKARHAELSRTLPAALGNILVFLLVGIWHGLAPNYLLWGLYNGLILAVSALLESRYKAFSDRHSALVHSRFFHVVRILRTFLIVNIGWYFDRSLKGLQAFSMLRRTFSPMLFQLRDGVLLDLGLSLADWRILGIGTAVLFLVSLLSERGLDVRAFVLSRRLSLRWLLVMALAFFTPAHFDGQGGGSADFMYAVF